MRSHLSLTAAAMLLGASDVITAVRRGAEQSGPAPRKPEATAAPSEFLQSMRITVGKNRMPHMGKKELAKAAKRAAKMKDAP